MRPQIAISYVTYQVSSSIKVPVDNAARAFAAIGDAGVGPAIDVQACRANMLRSWPVAPVGSGRHAWMREIWSTALARSEYTDCAANNSRSVRSGGSFDSSSII